MTEHDVADRTVLVTNLPPEVIDGGEGYDAANHCGLGMILMSYGGAGTCLGGSRVPRRRWHASSGYAMSMARKRLGILNANE